MRRAVVEVAGKNNREGAEELTSPEGVARHGESTAEGAAFLVVGGSEALAEPVEKSGKVRHSADASQERVGK